MFVSIQFTLGRKRLGARQLEVKKMTFREHTNSFSVGTATDVKQSDEIVIVIVITIDSEIDTARLRTILGGTKRDLSGARRWASEARLPVC